MKRNQQTTKQARRAKTLPAYEARKAAELAAKIAAQKLAAQESKPFNPAIVIGKR